VLLELAFGPRSFAARSLFLSDIVAQDWEESKKNNELALEMIVSGSGMLYWIDGARVVSRDRNVACRLKLSSIRGGLDSTGVVKLKLYDILDISKTSKCLISLNLLNNNKKVLNAIIFKEIKKKFQGNPSLENLETLNCLKTQFQEFQGAKSSFQAF